MTGKIPPDKNNKEGGWIRPFSSPSQNSFISIRFEWELFDQFSSFERSCSNSSVHERELFDQFSSFERSCSNSSTEKSWTDRTARSKSWTFRTVLPLRARDELLHPYSWQILVKCLQIEFPENPGFRDIITQEKTLLEQWNDGKFLSNIFGTSVAR